MTVSGSLLFSRESGFISNCRYTSKSKGLTEKGHLHLFSINLSSRVSRQDAWSFHMLNSVNGPLSPLTRCNVFVCRSFLTPSRGNEIPVLKTAATVLTRSYSAIHSSPLLVKLIPAVSIIAFAAWGLGPLMRLSRILFLHKNDSSWNKSSSHYVLTSYLQPLLLWSGATLVCRALDPVILPTAASQAVKQRLLTFVQSLSTVLAFSYCLASLIQQTQKFFVATKDSSDARNMSFEFAGKAIYTAVWVAAVSLFMELLGFSTQKWLTAGGLGTVLLTLAGREIFTNFLSSMMIHATRPFVVNEWIQTKIEGYEVSGTVEHMGWWSPTIIRGDDREAVHIPNHKFTVNVVRNLTQKTHWRIKTHLAISHLDVLKINNIVSDMRKVLAKNQQVEQKKLHRRVFLDNVDPESQALLIMVSCFVKTSHFEEYLCVKEAILLELLRVISHHRARLATPMRTVQKVYGEAGTENIPFSDPIFTHSGPAAANDRPFLLIEPSYKITSDDKNKDSIGSKPDANSSSTPVPDHTINADEKVAPVVSSGTDSKVKGFSITPSDAKTSDQEDVWAGATSDMSAASGKQEGERGVSSPAIARPALEDNIILGVALEGSKRTLPIEEEMAAPSTELMELAASRNGNGNGNGNGSEKKDNQIPVVRPVDQREKER